MTDILDGLIDATLAKPNGHLLVQYVLTDMRKLAPLMNTPETLPGAVALLEHWASDPVDGLRKGLASAWLMRAKEIVATNRTPKMSTHDDPGDDKDHSHSVAERPDDLQRSTPSQLKAQEMYETGKKVDRDLDNKKAKARARSRFKGGMSKAMLGAVGRATSRKATFSQPQVPGARRMLGAVPRSAGTGKGVTGLFTRKAV